MKVSYYCNHCHRHLRSGDHSDCRDALRRQRSEKARLEAGERNRQRYASGKLGDVLAKQAEGE